MKKKKKKKKKKKNIHAAIFRVRGRDPLVYGMRGGGGHVCPDGTVVKMPRKNRFSLENNEMLLSSKN